MDRRGILMFEAAIWVSALLTILAFMAAWTVAAARIRRPALRIPLLVLGALVALAPGAAVTYAAGWFSQWPILSSRLGYALSWTIACAAGVVTLAIRGEARSSRRAAPRVARWLFVKLALAFAGCLLATISIAWGRHAATCDQILAMREQAVADARAITPPPPEENAAPLYEQAFASLKALPDKPWNLWDEPWAQEWME